MNHGALAFWLRIAGLFLLRSRRTTVVLSLMVLLSVAILIFLSSLAVGINDAMVRNSVSLYSGHITGVNLAADLVPAQLEIDGVDAVVKRVENRGLLQQNDRVEPVMLVASDPADEISATALWRKITAGRYPQAGKAEMLLSEHTAERLGLGIGDELQFRHGLESPPVNFRLTGVYRTGIDNLDRGLAFCPPAIVPGDDVRWSAAVFLGDGIEVETVIGHYRERFGDAAQFETWQELMPDLRQLIDLNYVSMSIVTFIVFGLVAVGVSSAFVIFILKNLREYGIVKSMGVTPFEIGLLIGLEVGLMNFVACVGGVALGVVASQVMSTVGIDLTAFTSHNRYFAVSGIVTPRLTLYSLWVPPAVAFIFGLLASIWPAMLVIRGRTAEILRGI
ncbi:MAG: ABC transporter permease [Gammaproteobacteria bacterium]|nr:MAG: ABC transporter permease [Gammaproteobacteria bacterium]